MNFKRFDKNVKNGYFFMLFWAALYASFFFSTFAFADYQRSFINQSFEEPNFGENCYGQYAEEQIPGWSTTHRVDQAISRCPVAANPKSGRLIEIQSSGPKAAWPAADGNQFAELNAQQASRLYQTMCLINGETFNWQFSHRARNSNDETVYFDLGVNANGPYDVITTSIGSTSVWQQRTGSYTYTGPTQFVTIGFRSTNDSNQGNFLDNIQIGPFKPLVEFVSSTGSGAESIESANIPQIRVTGNVTASMSVVVTVTDDNAVLGRDYNTPNGQATFSVVIPVGNYSGNGTFFDTGITINNNTVIEDNKSFTMTLQRDDNNYFIESYLVCGQPPNSAATYTIINDDAGILLLKKLTGNRTNPDDQFKLTIDGPNGLSGTTTGSGSTIGGQAVVANFNAGSDYTLSEEMADGSLFYAYDPTYSCVNTASGQIEKVAQGSTINFTYRPKSGDQIICTFTNEPLRQSLNLTKKVGNNPTSNVGDKFFYEFTIKNDGEVRLNNLQLVDPLLSDNNCFIATIAPGVSQTCIGSLTLTQEQIDEGFLTNTAHFTSETPAKNNVLSNDSSATAYFPQSLKLSLVKTVKSNDENGNGRPDVGETLSYIFDVTNSGNVTQNKVYISDPTLDALGITITPSQVDTMPPNDQKQFTATYTIKQQDIDNGTISNSATAVGTGADPNSTNTQSAPSSALVTFPSQASLELTKSQVLNDTNGNGVADLGETITYTFDIKNAGNVTLNDVTIDDPTLAGANPPITFDTAASLAPTGTLQYTKTYTTTQDDINNGKIINTATAKGVTTLGEKITSVPSSVTTNTIYTIVFNFAKIYTVDDNNNNGLNDVGDVIHYVLQVTNNGTVTLDTITIDDAMSNGANLKLIPDNGLAQLAPGDSFDFTTSYEITQADMDLGDISNTATAYATTKLKENLTSETQTVTVPIDSNAALDLQKTGTINNNNNAYADVGETINYVLTVTNSGNVTLNNVSVDDKMLADANVTISPNSYALLEPGKSQNFTASYQVTQADVDNGVVTNIASANAKTNLGEDISFDGATSSLPTNINAKLDLKKTTKIIDNNGNTLNDLGDTIEYTITATNSGNVSLSGLMLKDQMFVNLNFPITDLAPAATTSVTAEHTITQDDMNKGSIVNSVTASAKTKLGSTVNAQQQSVTTNLYYNPLLTLTKTYTLDENSPANGLADVGEVIHYVITAKNDGNVSLNAVTVTDNKLASLSPASSVNLTPGNNQEFKGDYTVTQEDIDNGQIVNTASATSKTALNETINAKSPTVTINANAQSAISLTKTASLPNGKTSGEVGDTISYTLTVENSGTTTLNNVTITDPLVGGNNDFVNISTLAPGGNRDFTATYVITQADIDKDVVTNTATASGTPNNGAMVSDDAIVTTPITYNPSLQAEKNYTFQDTNNNGVVDAGETINFTISVTNNGNVTLNNVTLTDTMLTNAGVAISPASYATLAPNASQDFTASYSATQADINNGQIINNATATAKTNLGEDVTSNLASISVVVNTNATISLQKTASISSGGTSANLGDIITYSFVVTNTGAVTLNTVAISDPMLGTLNLSTTTLAPNGKATATKTYNVTQADVDKRQIINTATASGKTPKNLTITSSQQSVTTPINYKTTLSLQKNGTLSSDANGNGYGDVGDVIDYVLTVKNTGTVTLTNITIDDPLLKAANDPLSPTSYATLNPNESQDFTASYTITQTDVDVGEVQNKATATGITKLNEKISSAEATKSVDTNYYPAISLSKSAKITTDQNGNGLVDVGDVITYSFIVTNSGKVTLHDIGIQDVMFGAGQITTTDTNNALAPNSPRTYTATYTAIQADIDKGTMINNTATATALTPYDNQISSNPERVSTPTNYKSQLGLTKTVDAGDTNGNGFADVGETLTYTLTVTNLGTTTLNNIVVKDAMLQGGQFNVATLTPTGSTATSSQTYTHTVTQDDVNTGDIVNTASATAKDLSGATIISPTRTLTNKVNNTSQLDLEKTALIRGKPAGTLGSVGDIIDYTFKVTNSGNVTLNTITIADTMSNGANLQIGTITSLAPNISQSLNASYTLTQADIDRGVLNNNAIASSTTTNGGTVTSSQDTATINMDTLSGLNFTKTATTKDTNGNGYLDNGDTITYTLMVENTGKVTLTNVTINDPMLHNAGIATDTVASLAPTEKQSFSHDYTITQADLNNSKVVNTATATGSPPTGDAITTAPQITTTPLYTIPTLEIVKAYTLNNSDKNNPLASAGDTITYKFTITNTGNVDMQNIQINDDMLMNAYPSIIVAPIAALKRGDSITVTANLYAVTQQDIENGMITNTANLTATTSYGVNYFSQPSTVTTPVNNSASLLVTKTQNYVDTNGNGLKDAGDTITYTIQAENTGRVILQNITFDDSMDGGNTQAFSIVPIASLAPGAKSNPITQSYQITQDDLENGNVTNVVMASATTNSGLEIDSNSATVTTALDVNTGITFTKTASVNNSGQNGTAKLGDTINYAFNIQNIGNVSLYDVTVNDPMLGNVTITPTTIAPGGIATGTGQHDVTQEDVDNRQISNNATAEGTTKNGQTVTSLQQSVITNLSYNASLKLLKTGTIANDQNKNGYADVGDEIQYTMTVSNTGSVTLNTITLEDDKITNAGYTISPDNFATLAPGASQNFTASYTVTQADVDAGHVLNAATATSKTTLGETINSPQVQNSIDSYYVPQLSLKKTAALTTDQNGNGLADVGDQLTYTFFVQNTGTVTVHDVFISDILFQRSDYTVDNQNVNLGINETKTFQAVYTIGQNFVDAGRILNTATSIAKTPFNVNVSSNPSTVNTPINRKSELSLDKTVSLNDTNGNGFADVGEVLTYNVTVTNSGTTTLKNVVAKDTMYDGTLMSIASMDPSASQSQQYTHIVTQSDVDNGAIVNNATATATDPLGATINAPNKTTTTKTDTTTSLSLEKTAFISTTKSNVLGKVGDVINYTFTVSNLGNVTLYNVTINDTMSNGATLNIGTLSSLAPGDSDDLSATYTIQQSDVDKGVITNSATATATTESSGGDTVTSPEDFATISMDTTADLTLTKQATANDSNNNGLIDVGDVITYNFTLKNTGKVTLTNLNIIDAMLQKAGISFDAINSLAPTDDAVEVDKQYTITQDDLNQGQVENKASATGIQPNNATITAPEQSTITSLNAIPGLNLVKTYSLSSNNSLANVGDTITYNFAILNTGNIALQNIQIVDAFLTDNNIPITLNVAQPLPPGQSGSATSAPYTVTQADVESGMVSNTANLTADTLFDTNYFSQPSLVTTPTDTSASLNITKTQSYADTNGNNLKDVGDTITYTILVQNTGKVNLNTITFTDSMDGGKTQAFTFDTIASLAPGALSSEITKNYVITQADLDKGVVNNSVTAKATTNNGRAVTSNTANVSQTLDGRPSISLTQNAKVNDTGQNIPVNAGDVIHYTITITNSGNVTLTGLTLDDPLLGPLTLSTTTIAPNGTATATGEYTVTQADIDNHKITNIANASGKTPNGQTIDSGYLGLVTPINYKPTLSLVKNGTLTTDNDGNGYGDVGDVISYVMTVKNIGTVTINNITLTDQMLIDAKVTISPASYATLAPQESQDFTASYTVTQKDVDAGEVLNKATAKGVTKLNDKVSSPQAVNSMDTSYYPAISLVKSAKLTNDQNGNGLVDVGDQLTYSFVVTNSGKVTLHGISISDAMFGAGQITTTDKSTTLAPNSPRTYTATYSATQADIDKGAIINTATANALTPFNDTISSNPERVSTPTNYKSQLGLTKTVDAGDTNKNGFADVGETLTYTLTVTNLGTTTLNNIVVKDAMLQGGQFSVATLTPTGSTATSSQTYTHTVTQDDVNKGDIVNSASATSTDPSGVTITSPIRTLTNKVDNRAALTLDKSLLIRGKPAGTLGVVGDIVDYTFKVTNSGNVTLNTITIADTMSNGANLQIGTINSLAPNSTQSLEASYTLTQADIDRGVVTNSATASGTTQNGVKVTSSQDTATINIDTASNLSLVKTATVKDTNGNGYSDNGDTITYTLTVQNTGKVTLTNVTINDQILQDAGIAVDTVASLAPTEKQSFSHDYIITQADLNSSRVINSATATGTPPTGDAITTAPQITTTPLYTIPNIEIVKTYTLNSSSNNGLANVGDIITYHFAMKNTGNVDMQDIQINDEMLKNANPPITLAPIAALNRGASTTLDSAPYTVTQQDVENGMITNTANLNAMTSYGVNYFSQPSTITTPADNSSSLVVSKTQSYVDTNGNSLKDVGDTITYTIQAENQGKVVLQNITFDDSMDGGVTQAFDIAPIASLAPGAKSIQIQKTYTITQDDLEEGYVTNVVSASATTSKGREVESNSASVTTTLDIKTGLTLTKTANVNNSGQNGTANLGDTITYSFVVKNTGNVAVSGIGINDQMSNKATITPTIPASDTIAPTQSKTYYATYQVAQQDLENGQITNSATASAQTELNVNVASNQSSITTKTNNAPNLTLDKTSILKTDQNGNGQYDVGDIVEYNFKVTNTGNVALSNVTINDPYLTSLGVKVKEAPQNLAIKGEFTFTADYTISQAVFDKGNIVNVANATATTALNKNITSNSDTNTITTIRNPLLRLVKTAKLQIDNNGNALADAGDIIAYSLTATNLGNVTLNNVQISDPMLGNSITTTAPDLTIAPGENIVFNGQHSVLQSEVENGPILNTATANAITVRGQNIKTTASAAIDSNTSSSLVLEKTATTEDVNQNKLVDVGDIIHYNFHVENSGNVMINAVTISDEMENGANLTISPASQNIDRLQSFDFTASYTITQADLDQGFVLNNATASGVTNLQKNVTSNPDDAQIILSVQPKLDIAKTGVLQTDNNKNGKVDVGDIILYTFTVTNNGNVALQNVSITDAMINDSGSIINPTQITQIERGGNGTFTASYTVKQSDIENGKIVNTASATSTTSQGTTVTSTQKTFTIATNIISDIALNKSATIDDTNGNARADLGETINYTFTVTNMGNVALNAIKINDSMFAETEISLQGNSTLGITPSDNTTTFTASHVVTQDDVEAGFVENSATATGTTLLGKNVTSVFSRVSVETNNDSSIEVLKAEKLQDTNGNGLADVGEKIEYTFVVNNTGELNLLNPQITDALLTKGGVSITPALSNLAPHTSSTHTAIYTVTQKDIDNLKIVNEASVDAKTKNNKDVISSPSIVNTNANSIDDLQLVKAAILQDENANNLADKGEIVHYQFTVTNNGTVSLTDVEIKDDKLEGAGVLIEPASYKLAPKESQVFNAYYTVIQDDIDATQVVNTAWAEAKTSLSKYVRSENKTATIETNAVSKLSLVKTAELDDNNNSGSADFGETIHYIFTVENIGSTTLNNITIDDPMLAALNIETTPLSVASLAPDSVTRFTADYAPSQEVVDAGDIVNDATAQALTKMAVVVGSEVSSVTVMGGTPGLEITKTGTFVDVNGDGYTNIGDRIEYRITVKNSGNVALTDVTPIDEGPTFNGQPATASLTAFAPTSVALEAGASQDFTTSYALTNDDIQNAAGEEDAVVNEATASALFNGLAIRADLVIKDTASLSLPKTIDDENISIVKYALLSKIQRGQKVPFIIKVKNNGAKPSNSLNVVDKLPPAFRYVEGSASINGQKATPIINGLNIRFENINLDAGEEMDFALQAMALSTAKPGKHINRANVFDNIGQHIAGEATAEVEIEIDTVFDCGDIIGKVFDDQNRNGYQDEGESGLNAIRLATVNGELITSDKFGRFHIACAALPDSRIGSNYILKLDTRSLPSGFSVTTENPRVVRLTAGKTSEINFGATMGRLVRIDVTDDAFIKGQIDLSPIWNEDLEKLLPLLKQKQSILHILYHSKQKYNDDSAKLIQKRMGQLQDTIQNKWKKQGKPYALEIETRVEIGQ